MAHPLADFRLKLNRANGHREALKREIEAWFEQRPYGVIGKYKPGPPEQYVLSLRFFEPPPQEWGLLIGEFAHNARSALDYLAWQLVKANGKLPTRFTQFPIIQSPFDWPGRQGAGRLRGASDRHIEMVERLQPYHRRDSLDGASFGRLTRWHPLPFLSFLSNEDKHRVLVVTTTALQSIGWDVIDSRDIAPLTDIGHAFLGPLEDDATLLTIPVTSTGPRPEVEVQFTERAHITVNQRTDLPDNTWVEEQVDLLERMEEITLELRRIFEIFVGEFT